MSLVPGPGELRRYVNVPPPAAPPGSRPVFCSLQVCISGYLSHGIGVGRASTPAATGPSVAKRPHILYSPRPLQYALPSPYTTTPPPRLSRPLHPPPHPLAPTAYSPTPTPTPPRTHPCTPGAMNG
jgi:hypothetical protein